MFKWLEKAYCWFLWVTGFFDADGEYPTTGDREKITFMLRRQQQRLGIIWWVLSLGTLLGVWTVCIMVSWWFSPLEAFLLWLFVHILWVYKPPNLGRKPIIK